MKAKETEIDDVINKILVIIDRHDSPYTLEDKKNLIEAINILESFKKSADKALLVDFLRSLFRAFIMHKIFSNDDDSDQ